MKLGFRTLSLLLIFLGSVTLYGQDDATPASLYNEGVASLKAKEYNEALELMVKALEIADPEADANVISLASRNGAIAAYYSATHARRADKIDEAIETYNKGIELSPEFYVNYGGLALALNQKGEGVEAVSAYMIGAEMAVKSDKEDKQTEFLDNAGALISRAYSNSEWDNAIEMAQVYLEHTEAPNVHYYLARALEQKDDYENALEHINRAIEMEEGGEDHRNYFAQGVIYEGMGNTSAAIDAYRKVTSGRYAETAKYNIDQMNN